MAAQPLNRRQSLNTTGRAICDYSLQHVKSRAANVGDKLTVKDFGRGTRGFADVSETDIPGDQAVAVCVLPGTEIAFEKPVQMQKYYSCDGSDVQDTVARFRQIDKETELTHHDALEFGNGKFVKLTYLVTGQTCTILQLPAAPKNETEAKEQERLAVVA